MCPKKTLEKEWEFKVYVVLSFLCVYVVKLQTRSLKVEKSTRKYY